jgi:hypothetical protein
VLAFILTVDQMLGSRSSVATKEDR